MPTLKTVEEKIQRIERFRVSFIWNGVDVKGNKENIPQYEYSIAAQGKWTVADWKRERFSKKYPGFDVKVFEKDGTVAAGNRTLENVRGEK